MSYSRATIGLAFVLLANPHVAAQEPAAEPVPPAHAENFWVDSVPNRFDDVAAIRLTHAAGAVAFSPTEKLLVTADRDGNRLRAWNSETGELAWAETLAVPGFKALSFTRDGANLVLDLAEPGENPLRAGVAVLEVSSRRLVWQSAPVERGPAGSSPALDLSPDDQLITIPKQAVIEIRALATGNLVQTLEGHEGNVDVLLFSPDAKRLLSGTREKQVCLWDVATGERVATLALSRVGSHGVAFLRDQTPVVITFDTANPSDRFGIVSVLSGQPVANTSEESAPFDEFADEFPERHALLCGELNSLAWPMASPDRKSILFVFGARCVGTFLALVSAETDRLVSSAVPVEQFRWDRCGFLPDSRWAFVISMDPSARLGDLEQSLFLWTAATGGHAVRLQPPGGVLQARFSADGATAAIVGKEHVWLWKDVEGLAK